MSTTHVAALILFGLGAVGGLTLAVLRVRGGNPPLGLAVVHGIAAAAGLVILAIGVIGSGLGGAALASLVLFVAAAIGGFVMLSIHLKGKLIPIGLVVGHGTLAVAGFVALVVHLLG